MRRVVVTGLGLVTPLGAGVETVWSNLLASKSGAGPITRFDASDQKCRIACEVKPADHEWGFDASKRVDTKVQRQVDPFIVYGIDAAGQATERWPDNPNGSPSGIAGVCDPTGRLFGLMPHPDAFLYPYQHPQAFRRQRSDALPEEGAGLAIFRNGVEAAAGPI